MWGWLKRKREPDPYSPGEQKILKAVLDTHGATTSKLEELMATVEELTTLATQIKTDLEAQTTAIMAEFKKLEEEVTAGGGITPTALDPIKAQLEGLDSAVKGISVPTT